MNSKKLSKSSQIKIKKKKISDKIAIKEAKELMEAQKPKIKEAKNKIQSFSLKQLVLLTWWNENSPYKEKKGIIADGSVRSGKTFVMSLSFVLWAMQNYDGENFIMAGKTLSSLERNVIKDLLKNVRNRGFQVTRKSTENLIIIKGENSENNFYLFGGKDEGSQDIVQGLTAAGAYFDEVALMPESFVNQATARCSVEGAKFFFNCNPEHPEHYFKLEWIDKITEKEMIRLHFTMDDNPSLSDRVKAFYNKLYSGVWHDRYIKGLWRRAAGIIYRKYADNPERFIVDECKERLIQINVGVDFGHTKSATTFIATGFTEGFKHVYVLDEMVLKEELTPETLNNHFTNFIRRVYNDYKRAISVKCDSAEPVLIRGLQTKAILERLPCVIGSAKKSAIKDRINATLLMFGADKLKILRKCKEMQSAFLSAIWDEKHPDERLDEVGLNNPVDKLDSFEYSFEDFMNVLVDLATLKAA